MQVMQTETIIIMIVGLCAIGLIRFVIAMVGREYAADHPHVKAKSTTSDMVEGAEGSEALPEVPTQRPMRGTGRKSHLLYLPNADAEPTPIDASEATPQAS